MNMPMNFGQAVEEKSFSGEVIPKDTLVWCHFKLRGFKNSKQTNGRYLDIELTVAENQPHAGRKIWDKMADPFDESNGVEWRNMAYGAIRRILEAVKGANPSDANSYALNSLEDLNGLVVPVRVGIEKGSGDYPDDKNGVDYISPFSSVKKVVECYELLKSGVFTCSKEKAKPQAPAQGNMFAGTQTAPPAAMPPQQQVNQQVQDPNWLAQQQQVPNPGFQQGATPPQQQPVGSPASAAATMQPVQTNTAPPVAAAQESPSNVPPAQFRTA